MSAFLPFCGRKEQWNQKCSNCVTNCETCTGISNVHESLFMLQRVTASGFSKGVLPLCRASRLVGCRFVSRDRTINKVECSKSLFLSFARRWYKRKENRWYWKTPFNMSQQQHNQAVRRFWTTHTQCRWFESLLQHWWAGNNSVTICFLSPNNIPCKEEQKQMDRTCEFVYKIIRSNQKKMCTIEKLPLKKNKATE